MTQPEDILTFWFPEDCLPSMENPDGTNRQIWFESDAEFDAAISERFASDYEAARSGDLESWNETPEGALALVIILDQFPRNMFRGSARAFATDMPALEAAQHAIIQGHDRTFPSIMRKFFYLPFQHSESIEVQQRSLELHRGLGDDMTMEFAVLHHDIIAEFGRFPHRNDVLGRESSVAEIRFLASDANPFK